MNYKVLSTYKPGESLFNQLIKARSITAPADFLEPSKENEYHYSKLKNMNEAVDMLVHAINKDYKILVVLDTDVDGIMSGSMVYRYLTEVAPKFSSYEVSWVIGNGKAHGLEQYGIEYLSEFDLIIACDSLSNEFDIYEELVQGGTYVILLDHHDCVEASQYAITVNSEMHGYPNRALSGAGVCYKFLQALDDAFGLEEADNYVDLAAVGIIADVMDMRSMENRSICKRGFENLNNYGLKKIIGSYAFTSGSVSFSVAPIINACQRYNNNELAAQIVLSDSKKTVRDNIAEAKDVKVLQKTESDKEFELSKIQNETWPNKNFCVSFISDNRNLTGLVANKISDYYQKPAIVLYTNEDEDYFTGSMRSHTVDNFKDIINNTELARCDGHQTSAGIFVMKEELAAFKKRLDELLESDAKEPEKLVDFELDLKDINNFMMYELEKIDKITGNNFKRVSFMAKGIIPKNIGKMKDAHTTFKVGDVEFFNWNNTEMCDKIINNECWGFDVIGGLETSFFRGKKTVNFIIEDYIPLDEIEL
jgi:single-stranded-DNA-specific exonuclease